MGSSSTPSPSPVRSTSSGTGRDRPLDPLGLGDPAVRRAYLLTKAVIVVMAAGVTALLAPRFGARLWWGWAVFAGAMALLAAVMLTLGRRMGGGGGPEPAGRPVDGEESPNPGIAGPVVLPVEDWIDLHPFEPSEIPSVVEAYLQAAWEAGFREVRIVHGKGIGVQRERVRTVLSRNPLVERYTDAPPERGGWGATLAWLRETPPGPGRDDR